jgi:hypothetical protein
MEHPHNLGQTREPLFWPYRELNNQHTPESLRRRSRLGENKCRSATAEASFRRHFAAGKLQTELRGFRVALASLVVTGKLQETNEPNRRRATKGCSRPLHRL